MLTQPGPARACAAVFFAPPPHGATRRLTTRSVLRASAGIGCLVAVLIGTTSSPGLCGRIQIEGPPAAALQEPPVAPVSYLRLPIRQSLQPFLDSLERAI